MPVTVKLLLLDLGNVLTLFMERYEVIECMIKHFQGDIVALEKLFPQSTATVRGGEPVYEDLDRGRISLYEFYQQFVKHARIQIDYGHFCMLYADHLKPIRETVDCCRRLQQHYPLVVVSNGDFAARILTDRLAIYHGLKFDQIFISYEHGMKKPALFIRVLPYLRAKALESEECLFIDDIYSAEEFGIPSILFDGSKQPVADLIAALRSRGVLVP